MTTIKYLHDERGPWLGDLGQLPRATRAWVKLGGVGKCHAEYRCADFPGVAVVHCGHPTAHRPYFFVGVDTPRKVRLLADAKAVVEAVMSGLVDPAHLG